MLNIAHRGASGRLPENTLCAFRAAIDARADLCELDVRLSRDGAAVVIHDEDVARTTEGRGKVADLSLAELKRLPIRGEPAAAAAGETVPTLEEVFELSHGRCGLNVELKCRGAEREVCRLIARWDELGASMVSSFDWQALREVRRIDPRVRIGLLAERRPDRLVEAAREMGAFAINPKFDLAEAALCVLAHQHGLQVYVWTVDGDAAMRRLIENGADGIMTNYPERLAALLSRVLKNEE